MKAFIKRGKHKGKVVEISQWCNDWFTVDTGTELDRKPFSPSGLIFTRSGLDEILKHDNNGMLLNWFEPVMVNQPRIGEPGQTVYAYSFKRKKNV